MERVFLSAVLGLLGLLLSIQVSSANINSYVITVPKTFRPGMLVNMSILLLKSDPPGTPVDINATFVINSVPISTATGQFHAGVTSSLQLAIPTKGLPNLYASTGRYSSKEHLHIAGSGGLTFNTTESNEIYFNEKGFSVYVQTDKGIYKPGQTVHMRVLAVYPDLKVYVGKMDIDITDPLQNRLAQWKDQKTFSGVVTKDFELSSQPNMGNWKISVEIEGRKEEKTFEVKEYVLPKFKVDVLSKSYVSVGKGDIQVSVSAKYTYGKYVKGKGKIFVNPSCYCSSPTCEPDISEFVIDGSHSFTMSKNQILDLFKRYCSSHYSGDREWYQGWYQITVNVSVTDELTEKTHFGDTKIRLLKSSIILKYSDSSPKAFKPNFPFQALIEVTHPDNTPVTSVKVKVTTSIYDDVYSKIAAKQATYAPDENGYIVIKQTISQSANQFEIEAEATDEYGQTASVSRRLRKFESKSNTFIMLTAEQYEVQPDKEIVCNVAANEEFSSFNYMVISRGNIIVINSVTLSPRVKSTTFKLRASSIMSPSAQIICYFVRDTGEMVADSVTIKVNGAFENDVSVEFGATVSKPGEGVDIKIKASPYSQVGLLAVDKSVLLMNKGNDFSVGQVMQELESYGKGSSYSFPPWWRWRRKRSFFPWYPSAENSWEIFERAGVTVLTDFGDFKKRSIWLVKAMSNGDDMDERREMVFKKTPKLKEVEKVRTYFPETWLWQNVETNALGQAQVSTKLPDTITSWVLSGFAVSNVTGFGVADKKPEIRVFQPFFVSMDLPYSIIRGEQVAIKAVVFNYEDTDMEVSVTLKSSKDWKNLAANNSVNRDFVSTIKVPANSGATVSFPIVPVKLGNIPIIISAQSTTSADAVKRNLRVEPEGVEQEYSYSLLLDFDNSNLDKKLELALPSDVVQGSAKATISVIGDIMGSSISGIENLLKMPYGCGEQNMINFAPSMFIRAYLNTVRQLTPSIDKKSIRFMTSGYQRELTYQHHDGSYSAFGERFGKRSSGSLWLTAFVVKSFSRAKSYIYIDPKSLEKSIQFMMSRQEKDGSFTESGSVSSYLQGGLKSSNAEALTAYVVVSLLETGDQSSQTVKKGISSAVQFLKNKFKTITDVYTLAIVAYAMELANDSATETVLNELMKQAVRQDGTLHWTEKSSVTEKEQRWFRPYYKPRSADIEITSYVLLVYAHKHDKRNGLPIARWLAQQRNSLGGYSSTQDTVIGLQALSEFAPLIFSPDLNFTVDVKLSSYASFKKTFQVDKNNMIVLQKAELPTVNGEVLISGIGKGIGVLQVGVTYNVDKAPTDDSFEIIVQVIKADKNKIEARSCVTYVGDDQKSGMAILEVGLPSGFNVDQDDINELLSSENNIKRIETPGKKAVLYFDTVLKNEALCVNLKSVRTHAVGKAQPIPVVIYDYYKPEKRATTMYATQENVNLCDVCLDCTHCSEVGAASRAILFSQFLPVVVFAIIIYNLY